MPSGFYADIPESAQCTRCTRLARGIERALNHIDCGVVPTAVEILRAALIDTPEPTPCLNCDAAEARAEKLQEANEAWESVATDQAGAHVVEERNRLAAKLAETEAREGECFAETLALLGSANDEVERLDAALQQAEARAKGATEDVEHVAGARARVKDEIKRVRIAVGLAPRDSIPLLRRVKEIVKERDELAEALRAAAERQCPMCSLGMKREQRKHVWVHPEAEGMRVCDASWVWDVLAAHGEKGSE